MCCTIVCRVFAPYTDNQTLALMPPEFTAVGPFFGLGKSLTSVTHL